MKEKSLTEVFSENYTEIMNNISAAAIKSGRKPEDITLLAAVKTVAPELINYAIKNGIKVIGDNRVQELISKETLITEQVEKHFIGHLQTNKVKDVVGRVSLIESVDSIRLAKIIADKSQKLGIVTDILLEVNIGGEESKSGFMYEEVLENLTEISKLSGISVKGLMAIPPICENSEENRKYFTKMSQLFIDIKTKKIDNVCMEILSMGMSDDYETAIECGSTQVRIGTLLFGRRDYTKK
ncbi:MAG: YggS family pyridoxal phosphate-dependent enzyme [Acutalibacteraceae bacterium]|nr:YggS family pyridoxal phosphate-dependent enzyme [Acutalibacteraceae bacterium]